MPNRGGRGRRIVGVASWLVAITVIPGSIASAATASDPTAVLRRQTQELFDAVTAGDSTVWEPYLAPDCVYADEAGEVSAKRELVHSIRPLPKEVSGKLELQKFEVRRHGETAVATFVVDEHEGYFGQTLHCQYLTTQVWTHSPGGWRLIAAQSNALRTDPPAVTLASGTLDEYAGEYELTTGVRYVIRRDGAGLVGQRTGRAEEKLVPELSDLFFVPGHPRLRKVFQRGADGKVSGFVERREAWDIRWRRVEK